jgi:uncharacterized protein involved in tellurium resistance
MNWLFTLVFAGMALSSDTVHIDTRPAAIDADQSAVVVTAKDETERFEQVYPFLPNGRVSVSNVNGSITVEAWDRNEIKLEYVKTADTKDRLADVTVNIDARPERFLAEAKYDDVRNKETRNKWSRLNVDFKLMVPRGAILDQIGTVNGSVSASNFTNRTKLGSVNGSVTGTNLRGSAQLETVNGEVLADFDALDAAGRVTLSTVNGSVKLVMPSDANATVRADSLNGNIVNDFNMPVRKGKYVGRDLHARLGNGGTMIKLQSVNGALSVGRKNDGRSTSPVTNLLGTQPSDEDEEHSHRTDAEIDREVQRAMREEQRAVAREMRKIQPELARLAVEGVKEAAAVTKLAEVQREVHRAVEAKGVTLAALAAVDFNGGVPQVKKKTNSFPVKGVPKVDISARGCSVIVRGWDKSEVAYQVTQFSDPRNTAAISMSENNTDSSVTLKLENHAQAARAGSFFDNGRRMRLEISVPKKSNLKIASNGEIRIEGVSGELELQGEEEPINVRDSDGKLRVSNTDGTVRVVGFKGGLVANTSDGDVFLDGDFSDILATASDGAFILTVPENFDANVIASGTMHTFRIEDLANGKEVSKNNWRFGKGGRNYQFKLSDGSLVLQNRDLIREQ